MATNATKYRRPVYKIRIKGTDNTYLTTNWKPVEGTYNGKSYDNIEAAVDYGLGYKGKEEVEVAKIVTTDEEMDGEELDVVYMARSPRASTSSNDRGRAIANAKRQNTKELNSNMRWFIGELKRYIRRELFTDGDTSRTREISINWWRRFDRDLHHLLTEHIEKLEKSSCPDYSRWNRSADDFSQLTKLAYDGGKEKPVLGWMINQLNALRTLFFSHDKEKFKEAAHLFCKCMWILQLVVLHNTYMRKKYGHEVANDLWAERETVYYGEGRQAYEDLVNLINARYTQIKDVEPKVSKRTTYLIGTADLEGLRKLRRV